MKSHMEIHTKQDYRNLLLNLLDPLRIRYSDGGARVNLNGAGSVYPRQVIELESFARPLWGLVPFWAGGGYDGKFEELYQRGIAAGTDRTHVEYWGDCEDNDQRFVEMAPIAFGLLLAPKILWEPLAAQEKRHLADWLSQINSHELPRCNWYFFRVLVNLALRERGCPCREDLLSGDLEFIETCYLGDGWYMDGASEQKDYYCAFAMQFYGLLYAVFAGQADEERCRRFRQRALAFSKEFIYWFDENGAGIPFGRSLTYRFAQTAFWSASLFAGVNTFETGIVKGVINRNFEYWLSKEIFEGDGTLSVGYGYPNLTMAEKYNAPGSPYWCAKTFLVLALPDSHPFWQVQEKLLPDLEPVHASFKADMLLQRRKGDVTAYVPGKYSQNVLGHYQEKYAKFAYSTAFGFSVAHSFQMLSEAAPDSSLAFIPEEEEQVYVRQRSVRYTVDMDCIISEWSPAPGIEIRTSIRPTVCGHVRKHEITSTRRGKVYDCGFSIAQFESGFQVKLGPDFAEAGNDKQGCRVTAVSGKGTPCLIDANPNTNLLFRKTQIPAFCSEIIPGLNVLENSVETWINDIRGK